MAAPRPSVRDVDEDERRNSRRIGPSRVLKRFFSILSTSLGHIHLQNKKKPSCVTSGRLIRLILRTKLSTEDIPHEKVALGK